MITRVVSSLAVLALTAGLSACANDPSTPPSQAAESSATPRPPQEANVPDNGNSSQSPRRNPATGHILKQIGEPLRIIDPGQDRNGPGTATVTVTDISRGLPDYDSKPTVRMAATITTGNDRQIAEIATEYACQPGSSINPDTGEELASGGGQMATEPMPTVLGINKTYRCEIDIFGLHDHGWLVVGFSEAIDVPYDLRGS